MQVEVVKSTADCDYTELIQVEAVAPDGTVSSAAGTLIGKDSQPRIVGINGREVEVAAEGKLLVLENIDQPGMVGTVGTILGKDGVNIADMSLSRLTPGGTAYMVVRVDTEPSAAARAEIKGQPGHQDGEVRPALTLPDALTPVKPILAARRVAGYLLGALPFGYLVARAHGVDIFEAGSSNPGRDQRASACSGARAGQPGLRPRRAEGGRGGRLAAVCSGCPGQPHSGGARRASAVMTAAVVGLVGAVLGHSFSCFTRFKGGKGVATGAGGFLVLMPVPILIGAAVWFVAFFASRYVSLASILAAVAVPAAAWALGMPLLPQDRRHAAWRVRRSCGTAPTSAACSPGPRTRWARKPDRRSRHEQARGHQHRLLRPRHGGAGRVEAPLGAAAAALEARLGAQARAVPGRGARPRQGARRATFPPPS